MDQPRRFSEEITGWLRDASLQDTACPSDAPLSLGESDGLITHSHPHLVRLGTGFELFKSTLLPAILSAQEEVIFVTCFWARSASLQELKHTIEQLAARRLAESQAGCLRKVLRFRICLSSVGFFQKLFHTSNPDGYIYPPSSWPSKLGLPPASALTAAGIDLSVKSLFFLPFSVMHPKYVVIDRRTAIIPSCNVSWENWLEGCVVITGPAVSGLFNLYSRTWSRQSGVVMVDTYSHGHSSGHRENTSLLAIQKDVAPTYPAIGTSINFNELSLPLLPTVLLPSAHHRHPRFSLLPWQAAPSLPSTPLNIAITKLLVSARNHIYIQTPNLTCLPVISVLLDALIRGVDVHVVTNRRMMLLEQILTAGTTTSWCVQRMIKRYRAIARGRQAVIDSRVDNARMNIHNGPLGQLRISYFNPLQSVSRSEQMRHDVEVARPSDEPIHTHLKLTIVDGEFTLLGSGNMDRASFFTSQELGILFQDQTFADKVQRAVNSVLNGRLDTVFDSSD